MADDATRGFVLFPGRGPVGRGAFRGASKDCGEVIACM